MDVQENADGMYEDDVRSFLIAGRLDGYLKKTT